MMSDPVAAVRQPSSPARFGPPLAMGAVAIVSAVLTGFVAHAHGPTRADADGLRWMVDHRNGALTIAAKLASIAGDTVTLALIAALACAVLAWRHRWRQAALVAATTGGAAVSVVAGKHLIGRARPPMVYHLVAETNQSYPSGHSLGSTAVFGVLAAVVLVDVHRRALRWWVVGAAVCAVAAIGVSRLYLGVHWPTDIVAGWLFGGLWLMVCLFAYHALTQRYSREFSPGLRAR
ncbi:phosphatase PAP2 family protein [Nocardia sp. NPDC051570]|uniref:phosphatase PAP2 family protein n=1 Tax=Nocardia sp. NPDC051570 TaxID=3364324 RepID=UPI0037A86E1A